MTNLSNLRTLFVPACSSFEYVPPFDAASVSAIPAHSWMMQLLMALSRRRSVPAGATLFENGDQARFYYMVEAGGLDVFRSAEHDAISIQHLSAGDLFIYGGSGQHLATCRAQTTTTVFAVDRHQFEDHASRSGFLHGLLSALHASEITAMLEAGSVDRHRQVPATTGTAIPQGASTAPPSPLREDDYCWPARKGAFLPGPANCNRRRTRHKPAPGTEMSRTRLDDLLSLARGHDHG